MSRRVHPGIRAVFFDAVGTLLFPSPPAPTVYVAAALDQGVRVAPETVAVRFLAAFRHEEAGDRAAGWATSEAREEVRWRRIVATTLREVPDREACFRRLYQHFAEPHAWRVDPDAPAVFAALAARGVKLGLASNYDARLRSVLAGHPALALLRERVVVSAAVGWRKPAAGFFAEVVRAAGCDPAAVLMVGDDAENDFEGATAAGLSAVLLDPRGKFIPRADAAKRYETIAGLRELVE